MARTVPVSSTQAPGNFITGALWNAGPAASNTFLTTVPMAVLYQTTVQSLGSGAATAVSFDTTTTDSDSQHSNTTNNTRFTCQVAGWYLFITTIQYANTSSAHNRNVTINKNGTQVPQFGVAGLSGDTGVFPMVSAAAIVQLSVGDYVETIAYQDSGGSINTHTLGSSMSAFWIHS